MVVDFFRSVNEHFKPRSSDKFLSLELPTLSEVPVHHAPKLCEG